MKKNETQKPNRKRILPSAIIWLLYILGVTITVASVMYFAHVSNRKTAKQADKTAKGTVDAAPETEGRETPGQHIMGDRIVIPDYDDITVTSDSPLMGFNNPIENEDVALLRYMVDADYESTEPIPLIQEEMWVLPGKTLPIDIKSQLDPGVYAIRISILAKDPGTDIELGADVQYVIITVE